MKTKPYPPYEEQPMVAGEPTAAYQRTEPATYRTSHSSKRGYTQEEQDELEAECLRPFTMADIHRRIDEAEAEIEAGEGQTVEEFFAELKRDFPWLY